MSREDESKFLKIILNGFVAAILVGGVTKLILATSTGYAEAGLAASAFFLAITVGIFSSNKKTEVTQ